MAGFFALLYVIAFVLFIIFLIKSILSKKKGMDNKTYRIIWIVALCVFFFSFIMTAILNPAPESNEDKVSAENPTEESSGDHVDDDKAESITSETDLDSKSDSVVENTTQNESIEEEANKYAEDEVIDQFITDYNLTSQFEMTDIKKDNIRTKYFGNTNDCYIEMINATSAGANAFCISINGGNTEEATERMFAVFPEFVHTLDSSISDEQIKQAITDFKDGNVLTEGYKLGDTLTLTFVPNVELSKGSSNSRIDIESSTYGNSNIVEKEEVTVSEEPIEMNALQSLFASINSDVSRDEIDAYIEENGLVKYAFTHDSAYYIGYDSSAISQRGRDREGEALDVNFVTSGDPDKLGMVKSAEFANHTGSSTHYALKFEDDKFYFEGDPCTNGEEAMQKYLHKKAQ